MSDTDGKLYTCMRCDRSIENWQHIWICDKNDTTLRELVEDVAINIWKIERKEITTSEKMELEKMIKEGLLSNSNQENEPNVIMILKGLVPKELSGKKIIKKYKNEVIEVLNDLVVTAYNRIWKQRCKDVNEWEK
jgi:predicted metal-binding transcription factor (methanogenesis marker protein 9)